ncbi:MULTISPECIES: DUF3895 domain-containing protein [Bacillus]|uniref:DUF3895 domain-containing protein n=1 Tax=Bacillus TaxID=1386 RepID=UPI0013636927|nr:MULTISPECIES: DUF3895 domain-containing protein [Bacillus]KAF6603768.1 DUF3895 domain-containing protein [Bacillus sp. EKM420B]KAF6608596.1 DUF3895 domain-containing protein [Bacillus sp. EKM417B]MBT9286574.1 DUF3895 domain-containing protein [Bacillus velezensis]MCX2820936.1 DUF3895 domain-containing protein [Bacillus sp. H1F1]QHJ02877.1 DUF3895 domain-containing protein [Bacillus sp. AM1(2019)]
MFKETSFLNDEQKQYLVDFVKTKKVEAFNRVQKEKTYVSAGLENASSENMQLKEEWVLIDYIDNGYVNKNTPCECGRPLRYQYIVKNKNGGEIKRLGISHFEEHISLKKHVFKQIKDEFDLIEKEITEILERTKMKWSIEYEINIPNDFEFNTTDNIKKQLDMGLALSARQVNFLRKEVNQKIISANKTVNLNTREVSNNILLNNEQSKITSTVSSLNDFQKEMIRKLYNSGVKNPETICDFLIKNKVAPAYRYSTGKLKIFPCVCMFLETIEGN